MMKEIDINSLNRKKTYEWFKSFSNSTYSMNVVMNVTKLVNRTKSMKESFFIGLLYIVVQGLNSIEEMRMRLVDDKPILYDDITPAITVMTEAGTFENVRFRNYKEYKDFYRVAKENIDEAKVQTKLKNEYNPENCYSEYYITCTPWVNFVQVTHPIPDDKASQSIPRICWGKFVENNGKYELTLNITVSHIFVDGFHLSEAFNKIQEMLDSVDEVLK